MPLTKKVEKPNLGFLHFFAKGPQQGFESISIPP